MSVVPLDSTGSGTELFPSVRFRPRELPSGGGGLLLHKGVRHYKSCTAERAVETNARTDAQKGS